jgi:hypothetical protein
VIERDDGQRLVLEVDAEVRERGERALHGAVGEQGPDRHRDVFTISGRLGCRYP